MVAGIRITGGVHKGRRIAAPQGGRTRFTSGKVREAVFDIVGDVRGFAVLDLFAGAGSFTVEAASRGAKLVCAVEKNRRNAALLQSNLRGLSLDNDCLVMNMDVRYAVPMLRKQGKRFDLIFVDPPYEMGYCALTLDLLRANPLFLARSVVVFEHSKREVLDVPAEEGCEARTRGYGDTVLTVLSCTGNNQEPAYERSSP